MITVIDLFRHPESEMNALFPHLIGGRSNEAKVTEKGYWQAEKFAQRLKIERPVFDAVFVSPALRTREMARIAQEMTGLHPNMIVEPRIQEIDQGDWEGLPRAVHHTPEIIQDIIAKRGHHKAPNGESQFEVEQRGVGFAKECLEHYQGGHVGLYTHGLFTKCLLRFVQNWDPLKTYYTEIDNTAITTIEYHHKINEWRLKRVNDCAHLTLL